VPRFEPFRAIRYADNDLDQLVAPPYDVLSDADVDALQTGSPFNITVIDVPRGGDDRYERAAALLSTWRDGGVLVSDPRPSFSIYRMRFTDAAGHPRNIVGVLGGLEVVDEGTAAEPGEGHSATRVLPHERTTPKASTDRLDLTRATRANLSPVWGLSLATGLTELLAEPGEVVGRVIDDGVEHVVERVEDPDRIGAISSAVARDDVLIADGHHRYGISRTYRDEVRARGERDSAAEQTLAFVNELVEEQLSIEAIHRLYPVLHHELAESFVLSEMERPTQQTLAAMERDGFLVLYTRDRTFRLVPKPGVFAGVRDLDGAWLEHALGEVEVSYQHGLDQTLAAVDGGSAEAAVLTRPVSLAEIQRTAREGVLMPPKSTFFTPKLKTGFVLRPLT
jgi:uncharacterized protein (DUF1015 family)